ncbi:hypothetical protein LNN31_00545 [Acetobacterium wieringae]|uniref:Uncharacterized protein n=1 Tax=Acetobacterium wieringae TaxID=52694 RepID=A0ABY6HHB0_9FIRM|nr:hypothetical protein [Acetobacterium wieringae]UYO62971.1 hypothetical protein LNN31_00545 [Acetobacterium wieringae]VUZ26893.1 Uncharacterised protein [Acetobacterium wieringae]
MNKIIEQAEKKYKEELYRDLLSSFFDLRRQVVNNFGEFDNLKDVNDFTVELLKVVELKKIASILAEKE